jgi:hypothetical protein
MLDCRVDRHSEVCDSHRVLASRFVDRRPERGSVWSRLAHAVRRSRDEQTPVESDDDDDMRRAGDGERDPDATFLELENIANRSRL